MPPKNCNRLPSLRPPKILTMPSPIIPKNAFNPGQTTEAKKPNTAFKLSNI
jgi:hypothetical protein